MSLEERVELIQEDITETKVKQNELFVSLKYIEQSVNRTECKDHEHRLRKTEQRLNMLYGVVVFLSVSLPIVVKLFRL